MDFYRRAEELKDEIVSHRRFIHRNAESGLELPVTAEYICGRLTEYGIQPQKCGYGITACIGSGKPVILLRADMDALPMDEDSGEKFASTNGCAHTCGHDFHAAMLLCAARMLKEAESSLKGTVKLMFQPGEEIIKGCRNMIENGILENPVPDAALAFHVAAGRVPDGMFMYNSRGTMMYSADHFRIKIQGKGGHGAYPGLAVNPLDMAVSIYHSLQGISASETGPDASCVLTVCRICGGDNTNIIPHTAVMEGALRTDSSSCRHHIKQRIERTVSAAAQMWGGCACTEWLSAVPPLVCDSKLTEDMAGYIRELPLPQLLPRGDMKASASEDFACIAEKLPSAMFYLSAGFDDSRGDYSAHHPKVMFNEDVCSFGAAAYAHCAARWLEENSV